jgi:hypothetical protein
MSSHQLEVLSPHRNITPPILTTERLAVEYASEGGTGIAAYHILTQHGHHEVVFSKAPSSDYRSRRPEITYLAPVIIRAIASTHRLDIHQIKVLEVQTHLSNPNECAPGTWRLIEIYRIDWELCHVRGWRPIATDDPRVSQLISQVFDPCIHVPKHVGQSHGRELKYVFRELCT